MAGSEISPAQRSQLTPSGEGSPAVIDWHAHIYPPEVAAVPEWRGDCPLTIEKLLDAHERVGIDFCVVTNPIHYLKTMSDSQALSAIKRWNEYAAEVQQRYADRVVVFTSSIPGGGDEFLKELERAIREYGLRGVFINSSHQGTYPDEDRARLFFELINSLDVPVMIHAPASSFGEECMRMYRLTSSVGRPFDECLAIARMIVRGVFEQLPDLKFVGAHLGGGICEVIGRMDYAYELGDFAHFLGTYEPLLISHEPSYYLRKLYMDSVSYHAPALMCGIQTVGVDHVMFGSDAPPLLPLLPKAKKLVEELPIRDEDKRAILGGNAAKLLKLAL
jgi:aminocarboxymuconate-semialdehyde decarboxylase